MSYVSGSTLGKVALASELLRFYTKWSLLSKICCCSVARSYLTLCDSMDWSTPGFPVLHRLQEFAQTHVHWVGDAIQPSHPLSPPSPPAFSLSQHQGLFQWVGLSQFLTCSINVKYFSSVSGSWKGEKEAKKKNSSLKPWDIPQLYFWSSVIVCVCVCFKSDCFPNIRNQKHLQWNGLLLNFRCGTV